MGNSMPTPVSIPNIKGFTTEIEGENIVRLTPNNLRYLYQFKTSEECTFCSTLVQVNVLGSQIKLTCNIDQRDQLITALRKIEQSYDIFNLSNETVQKA